MVNPVPNTTVSGFPFADLSLAKKIADILCEHGFHVSAPDEGTLDDVEQERWDACVKIAEAAVRECIGVVTVTWGADLVTTQAALEEMIS